MTSDHPELVAVITAEIVTSGPMTFARFMELALYHPQFGYYTNPDQAPDRIGFAGDYYTAPDVHPVMGQALARQMVEVDTLLGHPDPFMVIEMGPGKGVLARETLAALRVHSADLYKRLDYLLIERSPALQATQRRMLSTVDARISWLERLEVLDPNSVVGMLFSNELVDAFPVHRICVQHGAAKEIYVDRADGQFDERLGPLSSSELKQYLARLEEAGISLSEGYRTEINLEACAWMAKVASAMSRGVVMTIDYGHTAQDLYGPERQRGTLLCYRHQMASDNPYQSVGMQDMTAHVDFSALATIGEQGGLQVSGFTNQMSFLIGLGIEQLLETLEPGSPDFQSIVQLLKPDGMGRTFKILVQHKAMPHPQLAGLRYKPFFGAALSSTAAVR